MKKLRIFALLLLLCPLPLSAQFSLGAQDGMAAMSPSAEGLMKDHFFSVGLSYHPASFDMQEYGHISRFVLHGVSLTGTHLDRFFPSIPLWFEYGLGIQYSSYTENVTSSEKPYSNRLSFWSMGIPINAIYALPTPAPGLSVQPFTGFEPYLILSMKQSGTGPDGEHYQQDFIESLKNSSWKVSRFNIDWHIGVRVAWKQFFLSGSYGVPLTRFANVDYGDETSRGDYVATFSRGSITLGYMF